ncbi:MAG: methyl-accepting chemotaxis protein [Leptospirales bacterium]
MINQKRSSLKRKMVFYFLLVAIANVFLGVELLWEINSESYHAGVIEEVNKIQSGEEPVEHIFTLMENLTNKFIIMVIVILIVSAVVLFLYVVQIASPIQYMINQAKKIAQGDLSLNIQLKSADELSDLGNLISDLTVNLQEIIVQMKHMYTDFDEAITNLDAKLSLFPEIEGHFDVEKRILQDTLDNMNMIKESFTLFQLQQTGIGDVSESAKKLLIDLEEKGVISREQCVEAMEIQKERGGFPGAILKELGYIDNRDLVRYTSKGH